ncbi:MAG: type VI secretion system protein TssL, long form [Rhizobiaceae bacterium]
MPLDALPETEDIANYPSDNSLLSAAAPLLFLFGWLRKSTVEANQDELSSLMTEEIRAFDRRVVQAGVVPADARIATYALCETADDVVLNLPGIDRVKWLSSGMLAQFFQTEVVGTGFFRALNSVLSNPESRYDLLELFHACLSLGFEGQYRANPQKADLERVRQDVYETLRYFKARPDPDLSPHWHGLTEALGVRSRRVPVWVAAAGAVALVAASYFAMRVAITDKGEALAAELLALSPVTPVTIERPNYQTAVVEIPQPVTTQLERIQEALGADIQAGHLAVEQRGGFIVIEINNTLLFASGRAELKSEFGPIAKRIALALDVERGSIRIVGHTDNIKPKKSGPFKSNYDLSIARAKAVELVVAPGINDQTRLVVEGKGEDQPIADNSTPEGRNKNRRVDLMIPREETL